MITLKEALLLGTYAIGMSTGQVLFKMAGNRASSSAGGFSAAFLAPELYIGAALYALLTVLWVWLLSFIPLSRAYPVVALTVVVTPILGIVLFAEPMSSKFLIGLSLIAAGLLVVWA